MTVISFDDNYDDHDPTSGDGTGNVDQRAAGDYGTREFGALIDRGIISQGPSAQATGDRPVKLNRNGRTRKTSSIV